MTCVENTDGLDKSVKSESGRTSNNECWSNEYNIHFQPAFSVEREPLCISYCSTQKDFYNSHVKVLQGGEI